MNCPNCNAELQPGATFCTNCGTAIAAEQAVVPAQDPGKGQGVASLILGIAGLALPVLCGWCYGTGSLLGIICSIIGLIMGSNALKASAAAGFQNGSAKAGKICSLIGVILFAVGAVLGVLIGILYCILMLAGVSMA